MEKRLTTKMETSTNSVNLHSEHIVTFLKDNGGNHVSHLFFLNDKEVYWAQRQTVLIVYKKIANKLVVLGDPIGPDASIPDAIREFHQYCEYQGLKPIFYQVSPAFMQFYHETGYRFVKLGEEGKVNLQTFTLAGKKGSKLRTRFNKFARNGFQFQVVNPPYSKEFLQQLKEVSDSWLGGQKEKTFSVVSFSEEYVSRFHVGILTDENDQIIAFATLADDFRETINIDLMRKRADSPHGTMDVLFIHILEWAKENQYQTCSLGMAPLSNVGSCKYSFATEKFIRLAYLYGNSLYNFKGLKEFKEKFACTWEPKYLAYKKTFLPATFVQLVLLINKRKTNRQMLRVQKKEEIG
ncbi:phosphatidylglycerol lysyltransferase domain-containing protein [Radiobacillus kanasensis]|uniref:phosphatidylglycerol lysyltransferase domain-containing protein n=1 Tax=Radiobacillus kanasensis TaxID=2844358 RepID=UPI001E4D9920|nr:phosphatidylglycerol lysyltransferase domain-containing protein [Radiobacillus kanasensis]UFU00778.1 phosphatidylglycerol lysyltransferase domain-containing protein [Radiobacillus kanasensis]